MYLKEFINKIGLSQRDFAKRLGLTQVTIARYETEKMNPTTKVIQKYIDLFNANPSYLFMGHEPVFLDEQLEINLEYKIRIKEKELNELRVHAKKIKWVFRKHE